MSRWQEGQDYVFQGVDTEFGSSRPGNTPDRRYCGPLHDAHIFSIATLFHRPASCSWTFSLFMKWIVVITQRISHHL